MATIWYTKEGEIQRGPEAGKKSINWCVSNLGLKERDRIADLDVRNLKIDEKTSMSDIRGKRFVVIEINNSDRTDAWGKSCETGYYLIEDNEPGDVQPLLQKP